MHVVVDLVVAIIVALGLYAVFSPAPTHVFWLLYHSAEATHRTHAATVSPFLQRYLRRLLPDSDGQLQRVFVPLCGGDLDLLFLVTDGRRGLKGPGGGIEVVGVDRYEESFAPLLAQLPPVEEEGREDPAVWQWEGVDDDGWTSSSTPSSPSRLTLVRADLFGQVLPRHVRPPFDAIYDKGALTAVLPEGRPAYVRALLRWAGLSTAVLPRVLLVALERDPACVPSGAHEPRHPPYPVEGESEVRSLFGPHGWGRVTRLSPPRGEATRPAAASAAGARCLVHAVYLLEEEGKGRED
jgi:hypothetical protein